MRLGQETPFSRTAGGNDMVCSLGRHAAAEIAPADAKATHMESIHVWCAVPSVVPDRVVLPVGARPAIVAARMGSPMARAAIINHGVSKAARGCGSQETEAVIGHANNNPTVHPAAVPIAVPHAAPRPTRYAENNRRGMAELPARYRTRLDREAAAVLPGANNATKRAMATATAT
ncbi:hypothetical protein Ssi02_36540 [Sinosporangium siamense]|uniref:Uncharacterized protein n=1 Tax=Sinosporangium siamense TaxID=1367973 RepID=A0A919V7G1_9ACTN|nr:hypothetical protein Ssi02_36540 [Sinosporangium siamense]